MVPFEKKLSYYWHKITGPEKMYGLVYEKKGYEQLEIHSPVILVDHTIWLEAELIKGMTNQYAVFGYRHTEFKESYMPPGFQKWRIRNEEEQSIFSRQQAIALIHKNSAAWERNGYWASNSQPFIGSLAPNTAVPAMAKDWPHLTP